MMLYLPIILTIVSSTLAAKLHTVHEWKYLDYVWKCEGDRRRAIDRKTYDSRKIFTIDMEKDRHGRVFVTTPQFHPGAVPASLSIVSQKKGPGGPLLSPYPNWDWHCSKNCKGITSVWRIAIDDCNRLWVLDSGKIGDEQVCLAKLLVFDLKDDRLIKIIEIPNDISHSPYNRTLGRLSYPVIETEGPNCERTWVYMVSYEGGGLVVYDGSKFWRRDDDVFRPDPVYVNITINGDTVPLRDGIFGPALTPKTSCGKRRLFFRPIYSRIEHSVLIKDLHKSSNAKKELCYTTSKSCLPSPVIGQAFSKDGIMFFGLTEQVAIACWNLKTPMDNKHVVIVAQDDEKLQYASGIKFTRCPTNPSNEQLWISTNRLHLNLRCIKDPHSVNFRILTAPVDSLVNGTRCQLR